MNYINKSMISAFLTVAAFVFLLSVASAGRVFADPAPLQKAENSVKSSSSSSSPADLCADTTNASGAVSQTKVQKCVNQSPVVHDIQIIVDFLSALVGIIVTGVIILGGIQYTLAGGNPSALTAARQRITNGLIALFVFLFIFAFLQWLIPGGIFK